MEPLLPIFAKVQFFSLHQTHILSKILVLTHTKNNCINPIYILYNKYDHIHLQKRTQETNHGIQGVPIIIKDPPPRFQVHYAGLSKHFMIENENRVTCILDQPYLAKISLHDF